MIRIVKNSYPFTKLGNAECQAHLEQGIIRGTDEPKEAFYRGKYQLNNEKHQEVRDAVVLDTHGKCSYCETRQSNPSVEHYRPHGSGFSYTSAATGQTYPGHTGYRWLCYEWRNLYASCTACNGKKLSRFPIRGTRVSTCLDAGGNIQASHFDPRQSPLVDENPLLINPELTDPEPHFQYDTMGNMQGMTDEGRISIELYDLQRPDLLVRRQSVINDLVEDLDFQIGLSMAIANVQAALPQQFHYILTKLRDRIQTPEAEYIGFARYIRDHFQTLVISQLETTDPTIVAMLHQSFATVFP